MNPGAPPRYDAVVIGTGPAGSAVATGLARQGARVCLVDRMRAAAGHYELIAAEALDTLRDFVGGEAAALPGIPVTRTIRQWDGPRVEVSRYAADRAPLAVDRRALASLMRSVAAGLGARLLGGTVLHAVRGGRNWTLSVTNGARELALRADVMVLATGRGRTTVLGERRPMNGGWIALGWQMQQADPAVAGAFLLERRAVGQPWYYGVPMPGGRFYVCCCLPVSTGAGARASGGYVCDSFQKSSLFRACLSSPPIPSARMGRVAGSTAWPTVAGEGWWAVGDAAFASDPLSGRGVDFALGSALNACAALCNGRNSATRDYRAFVEEYRQAHTRNSARFL